MWAVVSNGKMVRKNTQVRGTKLRAEKTCCQNEMSHTSVDAFGMVGGLCALLSSTDFDQAFGNRAGIQFCQV
jgi:hypothetical protein